MTWKHLCQAGYLKLGLLFSIGDKVVCPCCAGHFRFFLPYYLKRPNAFCPGCGSLERHRLMHLFLKQRTNFFTERLRTLEVAPLPMSLRFYSSLPNLDYVSIDAFSPYAMVKASIEDIPFENDHFDCILCSHVLEHVANDRKAMRELQRVLRPGGWAIIQSPVDSGRTATFEDDSITSWRDRQREFGQWDHVRIYGRDYVDRLQSAGFAVSTENFTKELGPAMIVKHGLDESERIFFCRKALSTGDMARRPVDRAD